MGFDLNDNRPLVSWHKWTTEINLAMIVAIAVFWIMGQIVIYILWSRNDAPESPTTSAVSTVEPIAPLDPISRPAR